MEYENLISCGFVYLYNKIQLYCKNVFGIKVPLQWQQWLLSRKNFLIYCEIDPFLKEGGGRGKMASEKKEWMGVKSSSLQVFFPTAKVHWKCGDFCCI